MGPALSSAFLDDKPLPPCHGIAFDRSSGPELETTGFKLADALRAPLSRLAFTPASLQVQGHTKINNACVYVASAMQFIN
jgi:hypothetical protein